MRHQVKSTKLNRSVKHRRSLYRNLIRGLILYGSIETTQAKAKAIKGQFDKLVTTAKKGSLHHRRLLAKTLVKRDLVNRLVDEIAPSTKNRTSGFTRIITLGRRRGDNTLTVRLELVDSIHQSSSEQAIPPKTTTKKTTAKTKATAKTVKKTTSPVPKTIKSNTKKVIPQITTKKTKKALA